MKLGQFDIWPFVEQRFRLDGGSMFGVIPKTLWSRLLPADDNNLIPMVTNLFVLKAHGKAILFETGLGDTLTEREMKIYGTDGVSHIDSGLQSLGLAPDDIDIVILTHLHTDHAGGAVKRESDHYLPRFPNAKHIVDRKEWQAAMNPNERTAAVYVPDRLRALEESDQVEFIDGDTELLDGIRAVHTGGHTPDHFALEIESDGQKLFYYADILCSSAHLKVPFVPATDLIPMDTMAVKRELLPRLVDTGVVVAFDHDVNTPLATITQDGRHLVAVPVGEEVKT